MHTPTRSPRAPALLPERLHPGLAVLLALALHALLLVGLRGPLAPSPSQPRPSNVDTDIELSLDDDAPVAAQAPQATTPANPVPPATLIESQHARPQDAAREDRSAAATASRSKTDDAGMVAGAADATESAPPGSAPGKIDLGLNGGVRRAALLGDWVSLPPAPTRPSDGGLRQGLAALDAERGQSRSNPANHAAYEAARRFAPPTGIGIFDIVADERGVVLSVTLASAPDAEAKWQQVGQELHRLLTDRRLRVAPGAKGLAARLRIETGELAKSILERFHSERGAALGQAPVHPREMRAESTRDSLEPGHLSPTLGVTIGGGGSGSNQSIRVVLVEERPL